MKAILVIDMPEDCYGCPCYQGMSGDSFCGVSNEDTMINTDTKPNWCPLKLMPQKKEIEWSDSFGKHNYKKGFNECIDEILGEYDEDTKRNSKSNVD